MASNWILNIKKKSLIKNLKLPGKKNEVAFH